MGGTAIRRATRDDLSTIQVVARRTIDLCYRSFLGDESVDWYIDSGGSDREIQKYLGNCFVLEQEDRIIAFTIFLNDLIQLMMVDVSQQNNGLGTKLLAFAENRMAADGQTTIRLETFAGNFQAIEFFSKNGWRQSEGKQDKELGFIRLYYEKQLS